MQIAGKDRSLHDLSHYVFSTGKIGRLKVLSHSMVLAGDNADINIVGAIDLSPLRRGLTLDCKVDVCSFYVPYRHIYGDKWIDFMKNGMSSNDFLPGVSIGVGANDYSLDYLGCTINVSNQLTQIPLALGQAYCNIYNNYFKYPLDADMVDFSNSFGTEWFTKDIQLDGMKCCQIENMWTAPVPEEFTPTDSVSTANDSLDLASLKQAFAKLETEQERQLFMHRYRDIVESFGGYATVDADNRPTFLHRTSFYASGQEVMGTDQSTLGQSAGVVSQSFSHNVPKFFCPEHGLIVTVALVRYVPISYYEIPAVCNNKLFTYRNLAGDPNVVATALPYELPYSEMFAGGASSTNKFKIAHSQWYRCGTSHVSYRYRELKGLPFMSRVPSSLSDQIYCQPDDYDEMFQTKQLGHWHMQVRANCNIMRTLPTTRTSLMTEE